MKSKATSKFAALVAPLLLGCVMATRAQDANPLPPHPRLLLDRNDIKALQERIAQGVWAERWASYQAHTDRSLRKPVDLPPRGGEQTPRGMKHAGVVHRSE